VSNVSEQRVNENGEEWHFSGSDEDWQKSVYVQVNFQFGHEVIWDHLVAHPAIKW
jgi:hypothetical protein